MSLVDQFELLDPTVRDDCHAFAAVDGFGTGAIGPESFMYDLLPLFLPLPLV